MIKSEQNARRITRLLMAGFLLGAFTASTGAQTYPDGLYAEIATTKGVIVLALDFARAPMRVASFVGLAEGTIDNEAFARGRPFFDGSVFDRVVAGHVIQGGMADSELSRVAGYSIPNEIHPDMRHSRAGMLGMDAAIARMKPGARWIVIVSPELGYPGPGYYPPARPGEPRFHISPNTLLIYEIEVTP